MSATRHGSVGGDFDFVVIVASLGGLAAISTVVAGLPEDYPIPVLIAQHRRPATTGPDLLDALLRRTTRVPIRPAQQGMQLNVPGIVVVPGGVAAVVDDSGRLRWSPRHDRSIRVGDRLLESTARAGRTIGVVLTGLLDDGADGCRAVKRHGGRVLIQDPETARAPGMPAAAAATGCADFVLPLALVPVALLALTTAPGGADLLTVALPPWARLGA